MSGWLLMGLPGSVYLAGTGEVWIAVGLLIGTILNWYLVSARLRKYTIISGNSLTIPSFFENRFGDKKGVIKIISSVIIAVFFTVYTASAFSSGAKLFATLFANEDGSNYNSVYLIGLAVAAVVILVYTFMGGFKAVCTTDFIQGLLMLVAILALRGFSMLEIGMLESIFHIVSSSFEIPSGVVADVFGRKKTMVLASLVSFVSGLFMILSNNFWSVAFAIGFSALSYNLESEIVRDRKSTRLNSSHT